jgi:hypothetical protein
MKENDLLKKLDEEKKKNEKLNCRIKSLEWQ